MRFANYRYQSRSRHNHLRRDWEFQNMLLVAGLVQKAALIRKESRGVHFRNDYPMYDDEKWRNTHIELSMEKRHRGTKQQRRKEK